MARSARLAVAGIPWHITQRGDDGSACFCAEEDYQLYLELLRELAPKHGCQLHAYVLMPNHFHLLLTPEKEESAARLMKNLGQRYVQYINRSYRRLGTLWDGRFRSCLVHDEEYVLGCYRYVEMNPVRAGMVKEPRDYQWSSYRANAEGRGDLLVVPHADYMRLGTTQEAQRERYRELCSSRLDPELVMQIRRATNGNHALGPTHFKEELSRMLGRRVVPAKRGRPPANKRMEDN